MFLNFNRKKLVMKVNYSGMEIFFKNKNDILSTTKHGTLFGF